MTASLTTFSPSMSWPSTSSKRLECWRPQAPGAVELTCLLWAALAICWRWASRLLWRHNWT